MTDPVQTTIKNYDQVASKYTQKYFDYWQKEDKAYIERFLRLLSPGARILDVGCGPGNLAAYFTKKGFPVVGIDLSQAMLKIARQKAPGAEFKSMDIRDLQFSPNSFEAIISAYSLVYVPKKETEETLLGFKRVIKSEGYLFLSLLWGEGEKFVKEPLKPGNKIFLHFFKRKEIKRLLEKVGFKVIFSKVHVPKDVETISQKTLVLIAQLS
ncbi:class I SAM-dependent methyltransferase [Patescibacteria group bacterium]